MRRRGDRASCAALGVEVDEDGAGAALGRRQRQPARPHPRDRRAARCCSARTSTRCRVAAPIEPVVRDGGWENANEAILGADNKVAVATMLALAERLAGAPARGRRRAAVHRRRGGRAARREGVRGRAACAAGWASRSTARRRSAASSSPRPPTTGSPPSSTASRRTRACAPSTGAARSSRPRARSPRCALGRLDAETTANIGTIEGGSAANVVPDRCRLAGEVRSLEPARAEQVASELVDRLADAANDPECECDLDLDARAPVRRLPRAPVEPRGGARLRRAARLRLRAGADRHAAAAATRTSCARAASTC